MGKKDKKRSAEEAGLVAVDRSEASNAKAVGLPTADEGETTTMSVDGAEGDESAVVKKKSKKSKKDKSEKEGKDKDDKEIPAEALCPIAHPLAGKKLSKKVLKTVKKG